MSAPRGVRVVRDYTNSLRARWSKREADILIQFPNKPDGHWLSGLLDQRMIDELRRRGYDPSTLRFSVMKDSNHERWRATHAP